MVLRCLRMASFIGRISSNGMITIPKKVRDELGIGKDTPVVFEVRDGELRVRKAVLVDDSVLARLRKKYGLDSRPTVEILADLRKARRAVFDEVYG